MTLAQASGRTFDYYKTVGKGSPGGPGFRYPVDLAFGSNGLVYVINRGSEGEPSGRASMFTEDEVFIKDFGRQGDGEGEFVWASSVAVDKDGTVYVSDEWLNRILIFDKDGTYEGTWGEYGCGEGQFNGIASVTFNEDDEIYITDDKNHRVQKFTKTGKFLMTFGNKGTGEGEFLNPWGITVDGKGFVYVADWGNNRIQKFDDKGGYISTFGGDGNGEGALKLPSDVAVDSDGDVYVADWGNRKLRVYSSDTTPLVSFAGNADKLSKWAQEAYDVNPDTKTEREMVTDLKPEQWFYSPTAVELGGHGTIWVVEDRRWRIQVYRKLKN